MLEVPYPQVHQSALCGNHLSSNILDPYVRTVFKTYMGRDVGTDIYTTLWHNTVHNIIQLTSGFTKLEAFESLRRVYEENALHSTLWENTVVETCFNWHLVSLRLGNAGRACRESAIESDQTTLWGNCLSTTVWFHYIKSVWTPMWGPKQWHFLHSVTKPMEKPRCSKILFH